MDRGIIEEKNGSKTQQTGLLGTLMHSNHENDKKLQEDEGLGDKYNTDKTVRYGERELQLQNYRLKVGL